MRSAMKVLDLAVAAFAVALTAGPAIQAAANPGASATNGAASRSVAVSVEPEAVQLPFPNLSPSERNYITARCKAAGAGQAVTGPTSSSLTAEEQAFCQAVAR